MEAMVAKPTPNRPVPINKVVRVPMRSAIVGATADRGIITSAIGSSPTDACSAE